MHIVKCIIALRTLDSRSVGVERYFLVESPRECDRLAFLRIAERETMFSVNISMRLKRCLLKYCTCWRHYPYLALKVLAFACTKRLRSRCYANVLHTYFLHIESFMASFASLIPLVSFYYISCCYTYLYYTTETIRTVTA